MNRPHARLLMALLVMALLIGLLIPAGVPALRKATGVFWNDIECASGQTIDCGAGR